MTIVTVTCLFQTCQVFRFRFEKFKIHEWFSDNSTTWLQLPTMPVF